MRCTAAGANVLLNQRERASRSLSGTGGYSHPEIYGSEGWGFESLRARQNAQCLAHIATLMAAAGRADAFEPYVAEVRARHKPKRNLMNLFGQRGW